MKTGKALVKFILFSLILVAAIGVSGQVLKPVWKDWDLDSMSHGFYETPENTLQVVMFGTSQMSNGLSPVEMYDKYGICAYNVGIIREPIFSSYYWLQEAWRLHKESLDTVVLDISALYKGTAGLEDDYMCVERSLDVMPLSLNKINACMEAGHVYPEFDVLSSLVPLVGYHSRWSSLTEMDFVNTYVTCTRGQSLLYTPSKFFGAFLYPSGPLEDHPEQGASVAEEVFDTTAITYFDKIVAFCREKGLNLLLIKIPKHWGNDQHNAALWLADSYDLPFIDYNTPDMLEQLEIDFAEDYRDSLHPNYWGALKLSDHLGAYLVSQYGIEDVRGKEGYEYMDEASRQYERCRINAQLYRSADVTEYLKTMKADHLLTFISIEGEAAAGFSGESRRAAESLGLTGLAELKSGTAYIGIVENGKAVLDLGTEDEGTSFLAAGTFIDGELRSVATRTFTDREEPTSPMREGDGRYILECDASSEEGPECGLSLDDVIYESPGDGIYFVTVDTVTDEVICEVNFDTGGNGERRVSEYLQMRLEKYYANLESGFVEESTESSDEAFFQKDASLSVSRY